MAATVYTLQQAIEKASAYCAVQERCANEMRTKLYSWGLSTDDVEQTITELIVQDFINEERFAKAFARGKFRIKHWGRRKIEYELKSKRISATCIQSGMQEIDETEYSEVLQQLIDKKSNEIKESNPFLKKKKLTAYLIGRGFEYELINDLLER
ncbi:RecX family transcriptional regulator [Bacteroidales bacterium OttesenSCG-928-C19]|nr:RecX family transcriptional regulator [Bacteroidales bacterium OttesenSCG-928-C19]